MLFHRLIFIAGWSSPVARQAHNLKVMSSNAAPAPNEGQIRQDLAFSISGLHGKAKNSSHLNP